ncbi:hypothetical protein KY289_030535 [Solanum tuberosum]|nr:hypothetical protein KY289_030535 [Solanum tuberosum]
MVRSDESAEKWVTHHLFASEKEHLASLTLFQEAGVEWIIHLDTDELMHPAGSLELVSILYGDFWQIYLKMLTWSYFLTIVERDDVKEPFSEVSMFRKNYDHLTKEMYFGNYKEATRGNPNYFLTYENGKSAARVQDHLRPNGAHRCHNYMKSPNLIVGTLPQRGSKGKKDISFEVYENSTNSSSAWVPKRMSYQLQWYLLLRRFIGGCRI